VRLLGHLIVLYHVKLRPSLDLVGLAHQIILIHIDRPCCSILAHFSLIDVLHCLVMNIYKVLLILYLVDA